MSDYLVSKIFRFEFVISILFFILVISNFIEEYYDVKIYTDITTNCEYLVVGKGQLTPRINTSGNQICLEKK